MNLKIKSFFESLLANYTSEEGMVKEYWRELEKAYTQPHRHYHTLHHIDHLFQQLQPIQHELQMGEAVWFAMFYHDIVYNPQATDNEEASSLLAANRLHSLKVPASLVEQVEVLIRSTAHHQANDNTDTSYFLDADLSILGSSFEDYNQYQVAIRKEFACYVDELYCPGRTAVLTSFLKQDFIFKTAYFRERFEQQARINLQREIDTLRL